MISAIRCRLLGHDAERIRGTFLVRCKREGCHARVNLRLAARRAVL